MKKQILFAAGSAILLLASCDKESVNTQTFSTQTMNYITEVSPTGAPMGDVSVENGLYKFNFDYNKGTISVVAENLPSRVGISTFTTQELPGGTNSLGNIVVDTKKSTATDIVFDNLMLVYTAYSVPEGNNIPGVAAQEVPYGGMFVVTRYTIGNKYLVRTIWPDMVFSGTTTTHFNDQDSDPITTIGYRVILQANEKKAKMVIYNAQFAPQMPAQQLVLEDLNVDFRPEGIMISGTNVVPKCPEGSTLTPNPSFPFDNIEFFIGGANLTTASSNFTVAGRFVGMFNGKYLDMDNNK